MPKPVFLRPRQPPYIFGHLQWFQIVTKWGCCNPMKLPEALWLVMLEPTALRICPKGPSWQLSLGSPGRAKRLEGNISFLIMDNTEHMKLLAQQRIILHTHFFLFFGTLDDYPHLWPSLTPPKSPAPRTWHHTSRWARPCSAWPRLPSPAQRWGRVGLWTCTKRSSVGPAMTFRAFSMESWVGEVLSGST